MTYLLQVRYAARVRYATLNSEVSYVVRVRLFLS